MLHLRHTEYLLIIRLSVINYFGMSPELLKIALIISRRENETGAKNGLNYETIAFESIERRNGRGRITYTYISRGRYKVVRTNVGCASDGEHDNYCDKRHAVACRLNT